MTAAKFGDPVLGIDAHQVMVPAPSGEAPAILPYPFVGAVFDPLGAAIGAGFAAFSGGGPVLVNGMPCGNTGTEVKGPRHVANMVPPALHWGADDPDGNGTLVTGSKTVHFMGASESREASHVSSCGFPVNLPTSVCTPVAGGAPVNIGGPEAVDWVAAATRAIRTKWMSNALKKVFGEGPIASKVICFLTGHPVDVMTGELIAEAVDFQIPGLIPIVWERNYRSRQQTPGALGPSWVHPYETHIEESEYGLRLLLADGRPRDLAKPAKGEREWDAFDRIWVKRAKDGFEVETFDGITSEYRPTSSGTPTRHSLVGIRDRHGNRIELRYEGRYLVQMVDTAKRELELRWSREGRLVGVFFEKEPLVQYEYDEAGWLIAARDALGHAITYRYSHGVMVKETHKSGLSFHFEWDWEHPEGDCIRTWGDGGIYDRRITYDKQNHFTLVDDGRGGRTHYKGNALNLVDKIVDPTGRVTEYEWSQEMRKVAEIDGEGNRTEWMYDQRGNITVERDPFGAETRFTYDEQNNLRTATDARGGSWRFDYDRFGAFEFVTTPLGHVTQHVRDDQGRLLASIDAMGREARAEWNVRNEVVSVRDGNGSTTTFEYDELGRMTATRDPLGRVTRALRDKVGGVTHLARADGELLELRRDAEGNLVERVDSRGRRQRFRYAGLNRLESVVDAAGLETKLEYDVEEDLIGVVNPAGERYRFELDKAGRVEREWGFDGRKHWYLFDKRGLAMQIMAGDYRVTKLARDKAGRVVKRTLPDKSVETFAYDESGAIVASETPSARIVFERDSVGRIVREHRATRDEASHVVESRFDPSGYRVARRTDFGHHATYAYDRAGQLAGVQAGVDPRLLRPGLNDLGLAQLAAGEWGVSFDRDPLGQELARQLPGGASAAWTRDAFGRPVAHEVTVGAPKGRARTDVLRVGYEWRGADQIASMVNARTGATRYEHDPRGHLIKALLRDGTEQYRTVDPAGNLFRTADGSDRTYGPGGVLKRSSATELVHDDQGQLTEKRLADGAVWKYAWDGAGRLASVTRPDGRVVRFGYDALGRRVTKEFDGTTTEYVWDGDELVHERKRAPDGTTSPLTTWLFEPGTFEPLAKFEGRQRFAVVTDQVGSPSLLLTEAGEVAWKAQLDIYGVPREELKNTRCPWRFQGQYEDEETGLYYNRFRYYDPETGQYITQDPTGLVGGLAQYAYVADPALWVDPSGLKPCNIKREAIEELGEAPEHMLNPHRHHIVMEGKFANWTAKNRKFVAGARGVLRRVGIDIQGIPNIVWAENEGHSVEYAQKVYDKLRKAEGSGKKAVLKALKEMGQQLNAGEF